MDDLHKQIDALVEQETKKRVTQVLDGLAAYIAELRKLYGESMPSEHSETPLNTDKTELAQLRDEVVTLKRGLDYERSHPVVVEKEPKYGPRDWGETSDEGAAQRMRRALEKTDPARQPYKHTCKECGNEFTSAHWNARLCSDECKAADYEKYKASLRVKRTPEEAEEIKRQKKAKLSASAKAVHARRKAASVETPEHPCTWCGKPTTKAVYCSEGCRKAKENVLRDQLAMSKPVTERVPLVAASSRADPDRSRLCVICGDSIEARHKKAILCFSQDCRKEYARRRALEYLRAKHSKKPCDICGEPFDGTERRHEDCQALVASYMTDTRDRTNMVDRTWYKQAVATSKEALAKRLMPSVRKDNPEKVALAIAKIKEENKVIDTQNDSGAKQLRIWRAQHRKKQAKQWPDTLMPIK